MAATARKGFVRSYDSDPNLRVDDSQTTIKMDLNESKLRKQALGMALADQTTQSYHESDIGDEDILMNEDDDDMFEIGFDNDSDGEEEENNMLQTKTGKNVMKSSSNLHGSNPQSEYEFLKRISSDDDDDSAPSSQLGSMALGDSNNSRLPTQMPTMGPTLQPTNNFESLGGFHEPNLSLEETGGNAADFMADIEDEDDLAVFNSDDEDEMNTPPLTQVPKFQREPSSRSNNNEDEDLLDMVGKSEKKQSSASSRSKEVSSEMDSRSESKQKQVKKSVEVVEKKSVVKTPAKQQKKAKESVSSDEELEVVEEKPAKKEAPKRELPKTILKPTKAVEVKETKSNKKPVKESVESSEGEDDKPVFVKEKKTVETSKKSDKLSSDDSKKTPAKKSDKLSSDDSKKTPAKKSDKLSSDDSKKTPAKKSDTKDKARTELKSSKDSAKEEVKSSVKSSKPKEEPKKVVKEKPVEVKKSVEKSRTEHVEEKKKDVKSVKEKPAEEKSKKTSSNDASKSSKTPVKPSSREDKENNKHAANSAHHSSSTKTFKKQNVKAEESDEEQETRVKSVKKDVKKSSSSSPKKEKERTKSPRHSPSKSRPMIRKDISELQPREVKALEDLAAFYPASGLEEDDEDNPRKATKLFAGITFVVTGCKRAKKSLSEITEVITRNGGKIAIFEQVGVKKTVRAGVPSLVLIGARAERTNKYILALAAGIPCVHYNWLYQSRHDGQIADMEDFLLPAGFSIEKEERISQLPEVLTDEAIDPVFLLKKGKAWDAARIEVVGSPEFKDQWTPILSAAGAKVVQRLFSAYENMDLIFSDQEPSDIVWDKSKELNRPLCNVEWAIQCIISHQYIDPMSRDEYRILVEEYSGSEEEQSAEEISLEQSASEE